MKAAEVIVALAGSWVRSNLNRPRLRFKSLIVPARTSVNPPRLLVGAYSNREVSATAVRVMVSAEARTNDKAATDSARNLNFAQGKVTRLPREDRRTGLSARLCS